MMATQGHIKLNILVMLGCIFSSGTDQAAEYNGYKLIKRNLLVPTGRRVVLLKDLPFRKGRVTHFHAFFGGRSNFHFQIWRRVWSPVTEDIFMLIYDTLIVTTSANITLNVTSDKIYTEKGDRLAFLNNDIGKSPLLASIVKDYMTSTLFNSLPPTDPLPKVGDIVVFDSLAYPYVFSVGTTYIPDQHYEYIGATGPTGQMGVKGDTGQMGPHGATGSTGRPGTPGKTGQPGIAIEGGRGLKGSKGSPGDIGAMGPEGVQDNAGVQGIKGEKGPPGDVGSTGSTGVTGQQGEPGPKGDIGLTGNLGSTGFTGATGPGGLVGATGEPGPPGPPGIFLGVAGKCNLSELKCHQECTSVMGFHQCSCKTGYVLHDDKRTCIDIDECNHNNGGCHMVCVNLMGSYKCQCNEGLKLSLNGHSCVDDDHKDFTNWNIIKALIIWVIVLTLLLVLAFICLYLQRRKHKKVKNLYQRHAESVRHLTH